MQLRESIKIKTDSEMSQDTPFRTLFSSCPFFFPEQKFRFVIAKVFPKDLKSWKGPTDLPGTSTQLLAGVEIWRWPNGRCD